MIILKRNYDIKYDSKQEERFLSSEDYAFFLISEKEIFEINRWKLSNIKKLISFLEKENQNLDLQKIKFYFSSWNKNIDFLSNLIFVKLEKNNILDKKNLIKEIDKLNIFLNFKDSTEEEIKNILLSSITLFEYKNLIFNISLINKALNSNFLNMIQVLKFLLPEIQSIIKDE